MGDHPFTALAWLLWLITAATMDLRLRKVRNWMVLLGLAIGLAALFGGAQPLGVAPWSALAGMLVAFAALLPFYALRWMGAGDVKFAAVLGLWFGLSFELLAIWVAASLMACLHSLAIVGWRHLRHSPAGLWLQGLPALQSCLPASADPPVQRRGPLRSAPYAGYLAMAAIGALWHARAAPA